MKALFMTCLLAMVGVLNIAAQNMDILPDTWVATDALGRVMPDAEVAPLRTDKPRTVGIVLHRDHNGYGGLHYTDTTGRNDIIEATVSVTRKNVIFSVTAADNLTPSTDAHWMLLYLDTDNDASTGWEGFDFFIADGKLCRYEDPPRPLGTPPVMEGRSWRVDGSRSAVCPVKMSVNGNSLTVTVPRKALGLTANHFTLDFKWADNPSDPFDIISISTTGDTAPNRRFRYRFQWSK